MTSIGMLHYRKFPQTVFKTYAFASAAKTEGADFFYFTPRRVNIEEETIRGWVLENGEWIERVMPYPDVIYNAGSPTTDYAYYIYDQLYDKIPFTSYSIGDKMTVYNYIKKGGEFSQYLLPSEIASSPEIVFERLTDCQKVIIKPVSGNKGIGIVCIERDSEDYIVVQEERTRFYYEEELRSFLYNLLSEEQYLVQPYIKSRTNEGLPYDFRLHVQKNGEAKWVVTTIYPRIASSSKKIVTNLSSGSYSTFLHSFLYDEFHSEYYNVKRYLEHFALSFARHMDNIYGESFDELGIDVGLDDNRKICLYEVNWRPGVPPTFYYELDLARNTIRYAMYLADKKELSD